MKTLLKSLVFAAVVACAVAGAMYWKKGAEEKAEAPKYRTAKILRTDIVRTVEATGTIQPIKEVEVGTQVNGKIIKLLVDYNDPVTNGQLVALIDPQVYQATYDSALGRLHENMANIERCEATLAYAEKELKRKKDLWDSKNGTEKDYDAALESRDTAKANLDAARAQREQNEASVRQAKANLDYCTIVSPVDGVVIKRSVDEGQTVVSSMNAVALVNIATDLKRIQVEATVPEADVGNIKEGQKVSFTVDAYTRSFTGEVKQIRLSSTTENNVVTYPIIIEAENPGEMLFPGMTATISVETARADNALAVSSAAFRFRPKKEELNPALLQADEAERAKRRKARKVWVVDAEGFLSPVFVETGVADTSFTQILSPADLEGKDAVLGYEVASSAGKSGTENPFMPKPPQRNKNRGTAPEPKK